MSLTTLTIESNDYITYASVAKANQLLAVDITRRAAWNGLADDIEKGIHLIAATRRLDMLEWLGGKAGGPSQAAQWPRSGLVYGDGTAVPDGTIPVEIERATILLAGSITLNPDHAEAGTSGTSGVRRERVGPMEVEYFNRIEEAAQKPIKDETVHQLIEQWLAAKSSSIASGLYVSGTGAESILGRSNPYGRSQGLA